MLEVAERRQWAWTEAGAGSMQWLQRPDAMRMAASCFLDTRLHTGLGDVAPFTLLIRVLSAPLYVLVVPVSVSSSSSKLAGSLRTFPQAFLSGSFLFYSFTIYLFGAVLGLCSWADFSLVATARATCSARASRCGGCPGGRAWAAG